VVASTHWLATATAMAALEKGGNAFDAGHGRLRPAGGRAKGRFPKATIDELRRRGHDLEVSDDWSLGRVVACARDGPVLKAAANPRFMQNYAIGR
jgi:gamma-glutamyltranspeptidase